MTIFLKKITHYHPEHVITNTLLQEIAGADPEWILSKTGICERRCMMDYEGDFPGLEIVKRCLLGWKQQYSDNLNNVGFIISASTHDDIHYPNSGNFIAEEENLDVPVFQIKTACTSVAFAIYLARSLLITSLKKDVLVLNGEAFTRYVDYGDKKSCILFGDAATVFLISKEEGDFEILDIEVGGKGLKIVQETRTSETSHLSINEMVTGTLSPGKPWLNRRRRSDKKFQQEGKAVVEFVLSQIPEKVDHLLKKNRIDINDIDYVILHQSNLIMMEDLVKRFNLASDKHIYNVDRFGNTSSAGWITALSENQTKIAKGALILISVFGAGMTWSTLLLKKV
jgi:3-oxoacyl-[acyl-carrier-protein] synthase III